MTILSLLLLLESAFSIDKVPRTPPSTLDSTLFQKNNMEVRIGKIHDQMFGTVVGIPITVSSSEPFSLEEIKLLISYNKDMLHLMDIKYATDIYDDSTCCWDNFHWYQGVLATCGDSVCPLGVFSVTAKRDHTKKEANCYQFEKESKLFIMKFQTSNNYTYECQTAEINFIWYDCSDNTITLSRPNDDTTKVFEYLGVDRVFVHDTIVFPIDTFPSIGGLLSQCFTSPNDSLSSGIDFFGGSIELLCYGMIDDRGDINLNEIANEWEDYQLFKDYFLYGISVFKVNQAGQIASTDVNANGKCLGIDDLVFLHRIVVGDALPISKLDTLLGPAILYDDKKNQTVFLDTENPIKMVWVKVRGIVTPSISKDLMELEYSHSSDTTNILITDHSDTTGEAIELFRYTGDGEIVEAQAATKLGEEIELIIETYLQDYDTTIH